MIAVGTGTTSTVLLGRGRVQVRIEARCASWDVEGLLVSDGGTVSVVIVAHHVVAMCVCVSVFVAVTILSTLVVVTFVLAIIIVEFFVHASERSRHVLLLLVAAHAVNDTLYVTQEKLDDLSLGMLGVLLTLSDFEMEELLRKWELGGGHGGELFETTEEFHTPVPPNLLGDTDVADSSLCALFQLHAGTNVKGEAFLNVA